MDPWLLGIVGSVVSGLCLAALVGLWAMLRSFIREQRKANQANKLANSSMQRDVLYRYFRIVVEDGRSVTPEEFEHIEECYTAYHANGGNGTGALMFEKIRENVKINTGREGSA